MPANLIYKVEPRHYKELIWIVLGQASGMVASMLTIKYLTNTVSPGIYGEYNLLLAAMTLPTWVLFSPISQPLLRYYSAYSLDGRSGGLLVTAVRAYLSISMISLVVFIFALLLGFSAKSGIDRQSLILAFAIFFLEVWISLGVTLSSSLRDRFRVSMVTTLVLVLRPLMIFCAVSLFGPVLSAVMGGYLASAVVVVLYALFPVYDKMRNLNWALYENKMLVEMLAYGLPFGIWGVFHWAQLYVDRYVLGAVMGVAQVGYYVAATQAISLPFNIAGGLISQFLTPVVYQKVGDGTSPRDQLKVSAVMIRICMLMLLVGSLLPFIYFLWGNIILSIFTSKLYVIPNSVLAILAFSSLFTVVSQQLSLVLLANNRTWQMLVVKILPGLIGVPLMWFLVVWDGLLGAAIGAVSIASLYLLITGLRVRFINKAHLGAVEADAPPVIL